MAQNAAQTGYDQQSPLFKSKQSFWLKFANCLFLFMLARSSVHNVIVEIYRIILPRPVPLRKRLIVWTDDKIL